MGLSRSDWFPWSAAAPAPAPAPAQSAAAGSDPAGAVDAASAAAADRSQSSLSSSLSSLSLSSQPDADAAAPAALGTLIVVVMKAKNLYNKRAISKQNPYCSVRVANHSARTKAITRGGQAPVWDHEARFRLSVEDDCRNLKLCVFDQNGSSTEIVGDAVVPLRPAMEAPPKQGFDSWYPIHYNRRYVGEVYLEMTFYPHKRKPSASSRSSASASASASRSSASLYLNMKHSESMPALRQLDLPSYMGTRPSRSPSPSGRRNSRPLPRVPDEELGIPDPRAGATITAATPLSRLPQLPQLPGARTSYIPRSSSSDAVPATPATTTSTTTPTTTTTTAPSVRGRTARPPLPPVPALEETELPPAPPRHAASVPTLPPMHTAQEDIFKQINDRYEASLFERLRPPASRPM